MCIYNREWSEISKFGNKATVTRKSLLCVLLGFFLTKVMNSLFAPYSHYLDNQAIHKYGANKASEQ